MSLAINTTKRIHHVVYSGQSTGILYYMLFLGFVTCRFVVISDTEYYLLWKCHHPHLSNLSLRLECVAFLSLVDALKQAVTEMVEEEWGRNIYS